MSDIRYFHVGDQVIAIRPIQPEDLEEIDAMHDRLSTDSLYYRYFSVKKPSIEALREQAQLSKFMGAGYVAVLQDQSGEIIGMAYYICSPDGSRKAEPGILIEDRFQGRGLGKALMDCLISAARSNLITCFKSYILPVNLRVLHLLEHCGLPIEHHYRDGLIEVSQSLGSVIDTQAAIPAEMPAAI